MNKKKIIVVVGATAVGKTKYSIELAEKIKTEIISGDSMLFYQGFNIGTAKPTMQERCNIVHHFIDILPPDAEFSVSDFQSQAGELIDKLNFAGKIPILAGGTGLYVKSLLEGYQFNIQPKDEKVRNMLEKTAADKGLAYLYSQLREIMPNEALWIHPNDSRRIIRALEVYYIGGEKISSVRSSELVYDAKVIGLSMPRERLYSRINERVELMFEQGWLAEVEALINQGVSLSCQAMQAIGYKDIAQYIIQENKQPLEVLKEQIKQRTRNFAKRQLTWYKKMPYIEWKEVI